MFISNLNTEPINCGWGWQRVWEEIHTEEMRWAGGRAAL